MTTIKELSEAIVNYVESLPEGAGYKRTRREMREQFPGLTDEEFDRAFDRACDAGMLDFGEIIKARPQRT